MLILGNIFIHYASIHDRLDRLHLAQGRSGYRLVKKGSSPGDNPQSTQSVPNGGERILIHPMETPDIYRIFAQHVDSAERLLEFVEKFGLLDHYEGVKNIIGPLIETRVMVRRLSSGMNMKACRSAYT